MYMFLSLIIILHVKSPPSTCTCSTGTGSSLSDVLHDSSVNSTCTCTSLMFHVVMSAVHVVVVEQLPRVLLSDSPHVHVPVYSTSSLPLQTALLTSLVPRTPETLVKPQSFSGNKLESLVPRYSISSFVHCSTVPQMCIHTIQQLGYHVGK